ncbi:MAG: helix-turn-helix transcriptional regulator [Armatimonadetes bacterium]|nr:helix-turn-helix transcriptional regulator [Armatimonadota bacterium]
MQRFGEKLHALRTQHRMTLKGLASALGLKAHGHLSELEAGKKLPTAEFVLSVARLFHTTTDQLLKDELDLNMEIFHTTGGSKIEPGIRRQKPDGSRGGKAPSYPEHLPGWDGDAGRRR